MYKIALGNKIERVQCFPLISENRKATYGHNRTFALTNRYDPNNDCVFTGDLPAFEFPVTELYGGNDAIPKKWVKYHTFAFPLTTKTWTTSFKSNDERFYQLRGNVIKPMTMRMTTTYYITPSNVPEGCVKRIYCEYKAKMLYKGEQMYLEEMLSHLIVKNNFVIDMNLYNYMLYEYVEEDKIEEKRTTVSRTMEALARDHDAEILWSNFIVHEDDFLYTNPNADDHCVNLMFNDFTAYSIGEGIVNAPGATDQSYIDGTFYEEPLYVVFRDSGKAELHEFYDSRYIYNKNANNKNHVYRVKGVIDVNDCEFYIVDKDMSGENVSLPFEHTYIKKEDTFIVTNYYIMEPRTVYDPVSRTLNNETVWLDTVIGDIDAMESYLMCYQGYVFIIPKSEVTF